MKSVKFLSVLIVLVGFSLAGCSEQSLSPLEQTDNGFQNSAVSLDKKGPIVHSVEGSGLLSLNGKNLGGRYNAHQYADGSFDGEYEVNGANALGDPTFKWNGKVLFLKIHENIGVYGGKMGVIGGIEKTGPYAGWYDVLFVIDNGKPGQTSAPDQVINWVYMTMDLAEAQLWWNKDPYQLIEDCYGLLNVDRGNITIK